MKKNIDCPCGGNCACGKAKEMKPEVCDYVVNTTLETKDVLDSFSAEEQLAIIDAVKDGLMPGFKLIDPKSFDEIIAEAKSCREKPKAANESGYFDDPIHPTHYQSYSMQTIDMMVKIYGKKKTAIFCELNAFKYRMRAGKKDDIAQDLKKEEWYLNKAKELRR